jgi:hypothetical protein
MSPTTNLKESIWQHVRSKCSAEAQACSEAVQKHEALREEYSRRSMLPGQAEAMVKHLSQKALDNPAPDMLQAHANVLAGLQAISQNPSVQFEACRAVNRLYLAAEGPVLALVEAATAALGVKVAELAEVERNFLAGYGFPYEATAISRLAISLKASINSDAFNRGKEAILNHPRAEVAPQINLANLQVLFEADKA